MGIISAGMPDASKAGAYCHATAVVIGEAGLIIQGASGSGKSSLALGLLDRAADRGIFGRLVGDDRIHVASVNQRILMGPHPAIAGRLEQRGRGILTLPYLGRAVARCIISIEAEPLARLPDAGLEGRLPEMFVAGVALPLIPLDPRQGPLERVAQLWFDLAQRGWV